MDFLTSLLFFQTIRRLKITNNAISWLPQERGPVRNSHWMALSNAPENRFLHIISDEENFPAEALKEIKQERMAFDQETTFPPCRVEIVLGREGRLFVVLFTGVKTSLPFACNAPFLPDPARLKIKDPASSVTNRWLLERIGILAAEAMLSWLESEDISVADRCHAYSLLPDVNRQDDTLEGSCARAVEIAFENRMMDKKCLISEKGNLESPKGCITAPQPICAVWEPEQISTLFDSQKRPLLSRHISDANRIKLQNWGYVEPIEKLAVLTALKNVNVPQPDTWRQLMYLWSYLCDDIPSYGRQNDELQIVPAQGSNVLHAAINLVRFR